MTVRRLLGVMLLLALVAACGKKADDTDALMKELAIQEPPVEGEAPKVNTGKAVAHVKVVDLEGKPLANMAPIITREANAFDPPAVTGALTDANGTSSVEFSSRETWYLRAWDPNLRWFTNNVFTLLPSDAQESDLLTIVMAPAAELRMQLQRADGSPVAGQDVSVMLMDQARGPWWPAKSNTDPEGKVNFGPVPPGQFTFQVQAPVGAVELPARPLPPGIPTDLGVAVIP